MARLRILSGREVCQILERHGSQKYGGEEVTL
jgi:hypothetical protein